MVKPIGPKCNLVCQYFFYLENEMLFGDGERWQMNDATLEAYVKQYIEAQPAQQMTFAWQGGEPTLCGVEFFEKVVGWQKQYGQGRLIENAFQTNGPCWIMNGASSSSGRTSLSASVSTAPPSCMTPTGQRVPGRSPTPR